MPITDYKFEGQVFFSKEIGDVTKDEAQEWSNRLKEAIESSGQPVVALVDALTVHSVHRAAEKLFAESSYFENLIAIVVATNAITSIQATTIGFLGRPGCTRIHPSLESAQKEVEQLLRYTGK